MSSGSTDQLRYGPAGFAAAIVDLVVLEFLILTNLALMYVPSLVVILPVLVVNAVVAFVLAKATGVTGQIGRGMLGACATATVALVLIGAGVLAIAIGSYIFDR